MDRQHTLEVSVYVRCTGCGKRVTSIMTRDREAIERGFLPIVCSKCAERGEADA